MRFRPRHWLERLAAHAVDDSVERRLSSVFQTVVLLMMLIQSLALAAFLIPGHVPLIPYLGGLRNGAMMLVALALLVILVRKFGRYRLGIAGTLFGMLVYCGVFLYGTRHIEVRGFLVFCLPVAVSSLLPRPTIYLTTAACVGMLAVSLRMQAGALPAPGAMHWFFGFTLTLSLLALILDQVSTNYRRVLAEAVRHARNVEAKNADLAEANGRLREAIAERERAEAELAQARKMEELGVMAAGVAHDFNNLLTGIIGNADLIGMDTADPATAQRVQEILKTGRHASDLCRQLMQYAGQAKPALQPVSISGLVGELADRCRPAFPATAELSCELESDLPQVQGDPVQLRQVIMNLVVNARDAIGDGPGRVEVTASAHAAPDGLGPNRTRRELRPGRYVRVSVRDTGCGMDEATLAKIFDPFFTTKPNGHGLGLASALGIVRAHGAGLFVDSSPGEGSCFTLLLPA